MNRPIITHGSWLVATIAAFAIGTQLARTSPDGRGPDGLHAATADTVGALKSMDAGTSSHGEAAATETSGPGAKSYRRNVDSRNARRPAARAARLLDLPPTEGPLPEAQLREIVRTALKSADPVVRRRAFDRLLQEVRSDSFTFQQALVIRSAMQEEGATPDDWRLFDYAWAAGAPDDALAFLDQLPDGEQAVFMENMIPGLASADPHSAMALFAGLDRKSQVIVRGRLFEGLIDHDLNLATELVTVLSHETGTYNWRPMDELGREVFKEIGLEEMRQWAEGIPAGGPRGSAVSSVFGHWASSNPLDAVQQIMDTPPSVDRDFALNGFTAALAHQDGETAVLWALEIENPGLKEIAAVRAAKTWARKDPAAVLAWLPTSGLSPEAQRKVSAPFAIQTKTVDSDSLP